MPNRRDFLAKATALGAAVSLYASGATDVCLAGHLISAKREVVRRGVKSVRRMVRREETIRRFGGIGDCWHMSWAADDRQYMSLCDGFGFSGQSRFLYNCRMISLEGSADSARFYDLPGYPQLSYVTQKLADPRYYPFGTLALDGRIYQFMSTFDRGLSPEDLQSAGDGQRPLSFNGVKLIYSPDNGHTWCNQDGSSPVRWESWSERSSDSLLTFNESEGAFSMMSVLQMGKNYELNRDGYVYIYSPNGNRDGTMNELVLFRAPKTGILSRQSYEYFVGISVDGKPRWDKDIEARHPSHTFPRGWVNRRLHPYAWLPSVVYSPALGQYIMTAWGMGTSAEGDWFAKPSYLGFWTALHPWGPWLQVYEEDGWMPASETSARAFQPQIVPKWMSEDGKSLWLAWSDYQLKGDEAEFHRVSAPLSKKSVDNYTADDWALRYEIFRRFKPYYSLNAQRVDLVIG